jgi:formamidase
MMRDWSRMAPSEDPLQVTPDATVRVDRGKSLLDQPGVGHNRWHPDIAPVLSVDLGEVVRIECLDGLDGQLSRDSAVEDVSNLVVQRIHPLTGPIAVRGAEPGDLLVVDILDVESADFGTATINPEFGFLREYWPGPYLTRWELDGAFARSEDLPGVRIPGRPFMGVMGVAPSRELLTEIRTREGAARERGALTLAPDPRFAIPGDEVIAGTGLRTCAPEEFGGNIDVRWLTHGTTLLLPVHVAGALFSTGDGHFAQGDGEVCGTAIETANTVTVRLDVRKGEAKDRGIKFPQFASAGSRYQWGSIGDINSRPFYATTGVSVTREGTTAPEDLTVAAKSALLDMVEYLTRARSLTPEQAYVLASLVVDLRILQCVDVPNVMVGAFLPIDVFEV